MEAILDGEAKVVIRERRGVIWCPFCDRSMMIRFALFCSGCNAVFSNTEEDVKDGAPAPAPRSRVRAHEAAVPEPEAEEPQVEDAPAEE